LHRMWTQLKKILFIIFCLGQVLFQSQLFDVIFTAIFARTGRFLRLQKEIILSRVAINFPQNTLFLKQRSVDARAYLILILNPQFFSSMLLIRQNLQMKRVLGIFL